MKVVVQRVLKAKVKVAGKLISQIGPGFLVFLGISKNDSLKDLDWLVKKIAALRIMSDKQGKMNLSLKDFKAEVLVVSQFTLFGDCQKGNRPSFIKAARPEKAKEYYLKFIEKLEALGVKVKAGIFQAMMEVELINDGPVTLIIER
ncbi:D-tyrosyl-tRNA(Tyr) deacylase [Candidatus Beckwithbacteria bacterium CG10_big_fil_rev_8_21_14_0_10_34_10]|uniref:D-aminoacyl-tRNA deacylase n=1 Tax=Candidatus Beckwithbacteria bacterium CG10_big_fil_rev_8_21_14_0_10_34_10 TaxID=1974495 RepID=A0A2H0WAS0_9BACT|nr:MAG: D-tyrosyl-tRNA(Tyr) deacylase [Candidatus Beckwithbacteria bacterium CG10_big_fil_rev_8_21_14_0_10_34_10]